MTAKTPTKIKIKMQKKQTIKIKNRINLFKKKPTILKVINRYKNQTLKTIKKDSNKITKEKRRQKS